MTETFTFCGISIVPVTEQKRADLRKYGRRIHAQSDGTHLLAYHDARTNEVLLDVCLTVVDAAHDAESPKVTTTP